MMDTNVQQRSKWTAKDYDDVKRAHTQLLQQIIPMGRQLLPWPYDATMAKAIKRWLTHHVPTFDHSWGSIYFQMFPPGMVGPARNVEEATLNLEANRLQAADEESREEVSAKDARIEEIKKVLVNAQLKREVLAQNVSANAEQSASAAKAAADLRKENDDASLLQSQEREAIAMAQAEEAKEEQRQQQAEVQCRLAESMETFYSLQAETANARKRALAQILHASQQDASLARSRR